MRFLLLTATLMLLSGPAFADKPQDSRLKTLEQEEEERKANEANREVLVDTLDKAKEAVVGSAVKAAVGAYIVGKTIEKAQEKTRDFTVKVGKKIVEQAAERGATYVGGAIGAKKGYEMRGKRGIGPGAVVGGVIAEAAVAVVKDELGKSKRKEEIHAETKDLKERVERLEKASEPKPSEPVITPKRSKDELLKPQPKSIPKLEPKFRPHLPSPYSLPTIGTSISPPIPKPKPSRKRKPSRKSKPSRRESSGEKWHIEPKRGKDIYDYVEPANRKGGIIG